MKKILLGLVMLLTTATMSAQIELQVVLEGFISGGIDNGFNEDPLHARMFGLDDLFLLTNDSTEEYHFYDADCNLYKRLKAVDDEFAHRVYHIARNVFTTDGTICRLAGKYKYTPYPGPGPGMGSYEFLGIQIIDEDGKIIQEITWDDQYGECERSELIKVGNKYKLLLFTRNSNSYVRIYSCPGNGETTTSVENVPAKVKRNAYPNPATDLVTLPYDANGATSMKIYDMQGKLVERKFLDKSKQELQLNVKDYPSGMYFFEVNGESNSFIVD
jgi:hypothetical protein